MISREAVQHVVKLKEGQGEKCLHEIMHARIGHNLGYLYTTHSVMIEGVVAQTDLLEHSY